MRKAHYTVRGKDVQEHAEGLIQKHLGLGDHSKKCTSSILLKVVFAATARLTSIFAACLHLKDAPSCETIRKALLATLPDFAELQRGVNRALAGDLPKAQRRKNQRLAIDMHVLIPGKKNSASSGREDGASWSSGDELEGAARKSGAARHAG